MSDDTMKPEPSGIVSGMPMYDQTLAQAQGTVEVSALAHRATVTEMLQARRNHAAKELEYLDAALAKAKEQEGAMSLLDAIAKTNAKAY